MGELNILVVEDDATTRTLLRRWLGQLSKGRVLTAADGLEALEQLSSHKVDLIVTDIGMPALDGMELVSILRKDPKHCGLEVVVTSGDSSEKRVRQALQNGITDYIVKPLEYDKVAPRLSRAIERARSRRQSQESNDGRPRLLVADRDRNFSEFATEALSRTYQCQASSSLSDLLVKVMKWRPQAVLLARNLPGMNLEFLLEKIQKSGATPLPGVYLLTDGGGEGEPPTGVAGWVARTFVPAKLRAAIAEILGEASALDECGRRLLADAGDELSSAVRQVFECAIGQEAAESEPPSQQLSLDCHGRIVLTGAGAEFELVFELACSKGLAVLLASRVMQVPEDEVDGEMIHSCLEDALVQIGQKIQRSCEDRGAPVSAGKLEAGEKRPPEVSAGFEWERYFEVEPGGWMKARLVRAAAAEVRQSGGARTAQSGAASSTDKKDKNAGSAGKDSNEKPAAGGAEAPQPRASAGSSASRTGESATEDGDTAKRPAPPQQDKERSDAAEEERQAARAN